MPRLGGMWWPTWDNRPRTGRSVNGCAGAKDRGCWAPGLDPLGFLAKTSHATTDWARADGPTFYPYSPKGSRTRTSSA